MRKAVIILLALCLAVPFSAPQAVWAKDTIKPFTSKHSLSVQLIGMNDFHGQLDVYRKINGREAGGAAYLASYLKKYEQQNKNTILVHAGDAVGASPPASALLKDEPTIKVMNKLGFDVGTVGNHEFDKGVQEMLRLIHGGYSISTGHFEGADFPYTAANVINKRTGQPVLPPYIIKWVEGIPIAFIGVVTTGVPLMVNPTGIKGIRFTDEAEAINKYAKILKEKGVHAIIVLAHVSGTSDYDGTNAKGNAVEMAKKIDDDVDVIFAGHNHGFINATVDNKLIVESYAYGTAFSDVKIRIDPNSKDIISKKAEVIPVYHTGMRPDPVIMKMVKEYEKMAGPIINEVIGQAGETIKKDKNSLGESALGDLIAASQRSAMNADLSFMNPGGIRADLNKGPITWGELYTIQPFNSILIKMTLKGSQVLQILNQQWNKKGHMRPLQIAGFQYKYDSSAAVGHKVKEVILDNGEKLDLNKNYTVAVNSFLANGGDGFTEFLKGTHRVKGISDLKAMINYIKRLPQPIQQSIENRIQEK